MHYMVCISGFAGAGKDECASQLVHGHNAVQTGLADPGKRHMADSYGFTEQQLFGPSPFRNEGDTRIEKNSFRGFGLKSWTKSLPADLKEPTDKKYAINPEKRYWVFERQFWKPVDITLDQPRPYVIDETNKEGFATQTVFVQEGDPEFWLSPREALQIYLEKMNTLDVYTWVRHGVNTHHFLSSGKYDYNRMKGLIPVDRTTPKRDSHFLTCFADFRHIPEIQYVREYSERPDVSVFPILIRVKRPSIPVPPYNHRSETEQVKIRDAAFDAVVHNDRDLSYLYAQIDNVIQRAKAGDIAPNPWRESYVIADRRPEEGYAP
jgi:hypothetical protein